MNAETIFKHWDDVRQGLLNALDLMNDDQLNFKPDPSLWSLGETVCHIAGAQLGWFQIAHGEFSGWDAVDAEARDYPTIEALKALLAKTHAYTQSLFASDAESAMLREVVLPWGPVVKVEYIVWHILEHEIHHRGEVYLMLGLQGIEAPDV